MISSYSEQEVVYMISQVTDIPAVGDGGSDDDEDKPDRTVVGDGPVCDKRDNTLSIHTMSQEGTIAAEVRLCSLLSNAPKAPCVSHVTIPWLLSDKNVTSSTNDLIN